MNIVLLGQSTDPVTHDTLSEKPEVFNTAKAKEVDRDYDPQRDQVTAFDDRIAALLTHRRGMLFAFVHDATTREMLPITIDQNVIQAEVPVGHHFGLSVACEAVANGLQGMWGSNAGVDEHVDMCVLAEDENQNPLCIQEVDYGQFHEQEAFLRIPVPMGPMQLHTMQFRARMQAVLPYSNIDGALGEPIARQDQYYLLGMENESDEQRFTLAVSAIRSLCVDAAELSSDRETRDSLERVLTPILEAQRDLVGVFQFLIKPE